PKGSPRLPRAPARLRRQPSLAAASSSRALRGVATRSPNLRVALQRRRAAARPRLRRASGAEAHLDRGAPVNRPLRGAALSPLMHWLLLVAGLALVTVTRDFDRGLAPIWFGAVIGMASGQLFARA